MSSVYIKQCEWAEKIGYKNDAPLYEVYVNDPSQVTSDKELITEVYYPVSKLKGELDEPRENNAVRRNH